MAGSSATRFPLPLPLLLLVALAVACGTDAAEESPDTAGSGEAAGAEALDPSDYVAPETFDTISWESRQAALDRGATVFSYSCADCHGDRGRGDGGYMLRNRVLRPPSFQQEDWRFGQDLEGLRAYIYRGNDKGMPHWGVVGLAPRDIDAVARFVQRRLWGRL